MNEQGEFLKRKFEEAGLAVRLLNRAGRVSSGNIFTLSVDVQRAGTRVKETFHLYPGNADVQVLNIDKARKQLVLFVHEPEQLFTTRRWDPVTRDYVTDTHRAAGGKSKYLVGMDERSYFMAPVGPTVSTVQDAHRALKPAEVANIEARKNNAGKVVRQGEWFFVPAPDFNPGDSPIQHKERLPGSGKPHVADELVRDASYVENVLVHGSYYARGAVRHLDHQTVRFLFWHRVVPNTEVRVAAPNVSGSGRWID